MSRECNFNIKALDLDRKNHTSAVNMLLNENEKIKARAHVTTTSKFEGTSSLDIAPKWGLREHWAGHQNKKFHVSKMKYLQFLWILFSVPTL